VSELAAAAGMTTGSLYHHFGSKLGLYAVVRHDVERRVVDRMRGAAAVTEVASVPDAAAVLLVGYDYLVKAGFARMLAEEHPSEAGAEPPVDPVAELFAELLDGPGVPISIALSAAWRACLGAASVDPAPARAALVALLVR
jgi:AcrR family transcriptional regulator